MEPNTQPLTPIAPTNSGVGEGLPTEQSAGAIRTPRATRGRVNRRQGAATPPRDPFVRVLPRDAEIELDLLQLRLDFHRESTLRYDYAGGRVRIAFVSALDVAHALASELDLSTGILPPDTLWLAKTGTGTRLALWVPPQVRTVRLRERYDATPRRLRIPFPGLVFLLLPDGQAPYVFAADGRPVSLADQLFHAPAYNVFDSGRVCAGTHRFPTDPSKVPASFFASYFSAAMDTARRKSQRHPEDVGKVWAELHAAKATAYPVEDLVPQLSVADAMRIGA
jgi:PRTRC genetic system protein B